MELNRKKIWLEKETEDTYYLNDPKLLELYRKSLPPYESYFYFPKGEEIIILNNSKPKKSVRKIYNNVPYTNQEKLWINQLKKTIEKHPETKFPHYWTDALNLAFIYAASCDIEKAYQKILNYFKFVHNYFPLKIPPSSRIIEFLNRGYIYIYGRDCRYRPIVVCHTKEFEKDYKTFQTEEILQGCYFLCQYMINQMLLPGQFETWNMIVNLTDSSILRLPEPVAKMIPAFSNNFVSRLNKNYLYGMNFFARVLYSLAKVFLEEVTVKKMNVVNEDNKSILFKEIRKDNIEMKFGGEAPNAQFRTENGLFPPRMPSEFFLLENENRNDILISEEEYIKKLKNGEILPGCENPEILHKINMQNHKNSDIRNSNLTENNRIYEPSTVFNSLIFNGKKKSILTEKSNYKNSTGVFRYKNNYNKFLTDKKMKQYNNILYSKWDYDEELNNVKMGHIGNYFNKNNGIINDIQKFAQRKNNYFTKKNWHTSFNYQ